MTCWRGFTRKPLPRMAAAVAQLDRITSDLTIFGGKPIVRGSTSISLGAIPESARRTGAEYGYPELEPEDILACLAYAHAVLANDRLDDVVVTHT